MQISRRFFDLSVNYKKTLVCRKFELFSINIIILENLYQNAKIFSFFSTEHRKISIFMPSVNRFYSGVGVREKIIYGT